MDTKFLKEVQKNGWVIKEVTESYVFVTCSSGGCSLRLQLAPAKGVPSLMPSCDSTSCDRPVANFDDVRRVLRPRREELALTIHEVEDSAGITVDFVAKFEKDNPSKYPNFQTTIEWAKSLGYEFVLRPTDLPPKTLLMISTSRDKAATRRKMSETLNRRRETSRVGVSGGKGAGRRRQS